MVELISLRKQSLLDLSRGSINMGFVTKFVIKNNILMYPSLPKVNVSTISISWQ